MNDEVMNIFERADILLADSRELLEKARLGKPQIIKKNIKLAKRTIPLWLVLFLIFSSVSVTIFAFTITALSIQKINLFGGQYQDTSFSITATDTRFKGKNKIVITVDVKNTDVEIHSCTVTIQLLDNSGNIINIIGDIESSQDIVDLAGDATQQLTFTFTANGLVAQFNQSLIIIKQTA